jgi:hypothetical protein
MSPWFRLDEVDNAIDNLAMAGRLLLLIESERRWKWALMALHHALYGFAVCAVRGTDSLSVLRDPEDHESHLISIHEALARCKDKSCLWPGATPLTTTRAEDHAP